MWRTLFRWMCIEILLDGFLIYFFYTKPWMFFFKDFLMFAAYFFFITKEPTKELINDLGAALGPGIILIMGSLLFLGLAQMFNPLSPGLLRGVIGLKVMFLPWLGILLGFAYAERTEDIESYFRLIAYTSIPLNIFGLIQYVKGPNFMPATFGPGFLLSTSVANIYGVSYEESFVRIVGTFASSAHYALFLKMNTLICLSLFFMDKRRKFIWLAAVLLTCFTLLCTGSRGGLLSTIAMVFVFSILFRRARPMITALIIIAVALYAGFSTLKDSVSQRFESAAQIGSIRDRTVSTAPKQFFILLETHPMGKGIGAATQAARHLGKREGKFNLVENYLSKLQVEMGIIGVFLFYMLMLMIFMRWFYQWLGPPIEDNLFIISITLTAYCFSEFFIGGIFSSIDTPPASFFLWIFLGMMARISTYDQDARLRAAYEGQSG